MLKLPMLVLVAWQTVGVTNALAFEEFTLTDLHIGRVGVIDLFNTEVGAWLIIDLKTGMIDVCWTRVSNTEPDAFGLGGGCREDLREMHTRWWISTAVQFSHLYSVSTHMVAVCLLADVLNTMWRVEKIEAGD